MQDADARNATENTGAAVSYTHLDVYKRQQERPVTRAAAIYPRPVAIPASAPVAACTEELPANITIAATNMVPKKKNAFVAIVVL